MSARTQRHAINALLKALEHCEDARMMLDESRSDATREWDTRPQIVQDIEAVLMAAEDLAEARMACSEAIWEWPR